MKRVFLLFTVLLVIISYPIDCGAVSGNVFCKKAGEGKRIALTFDDGPHPIYTPKILDILEKYGINATFFVIGKNVENYPDAARAILESDSEVGNHTYTHKNVSRMSEKQLMYELEMTEKAVAALSDRRLCLFRPPEGSYGLPLEKASISKGYDIILWSIDTLDWAHTPANKIISDVKKKISGGDIILMHDYTSGGHTCEALEKLIPMLLSEGYEFVTVSELICEE